MHITYTASSGYMVQCKRFNLKSGIIGSTADTHPWAPLWLSAIWLWPVHPFSFYLLVIYWDRLLQSLHLSLLALILLTISGFLKNSYSWGFYLIGHLHLITWPNFKNYTGWIKRKLYQTLQKSTKLKFSLFCLPVAYGWRNVWMYLRIIC